MSDGALMKKQGRITLNINKLQLYHSLFIGGLPGRNAEDAAEQDLRSVRGERNGRQEDGSAACFSRPGRLRRDHLSAPHPNSWLEDI